MKKPRKPGSGGKRTGAGRPKKEPTVTVSFRIKPDQVEPVKDAVKNIINSQSNNETMENNLPTHMVWGTSCLFAGTEKECFDWLRGKRFNIAGVQIRPCTRAGFSWYNENRAPIIF